MHNTFGKMRLTIEEIHTNASVEKRRRIAANEGMSEREILMSGSRRVLELVAVVLGELPLLLQTRY